MPFEVALKNLKRILNEFLAILKFEEVENTINALNGAYDCVIELVIKKILVLIGIHLVVAQKESCKEIVVELGKGYDKMEILQFLIGGLYKLFLVVVLDPVPKLPPVALLPKLNELLLPLGLKKEFLLPTHLVF